MYPFPSSSRLPDVDPAAAAELLARGAAWLLDVREPEEWSAPGTVA